MPIDRETAHQDLAALSVAAAELIEDVHTDLVMTLPETAQSHAARVVQLKKLVEGLQRLLEAAQALVDQQES